jgi:cysteine desulfurase
VPVYLDHAATTPMAPEAIAAMTAALGTVGNPSSIHSAGQAARRALEEARETIAATLGCDPIEVVFTGGGTEAVNLGVKGLFWHRMTPDRRRILAPLGEHHATLDALEWLAAREGALVEWVPVDAHGRVDLAALAATLGPDVALVTLLAANNEIGTLQPVAEVAALAAEHGVPVHVDAIAAYGQVPIDFRASGAAVLSVSAHKIGGPLGIGALVVGRGVTVDALVHGGGQERRLRAGTQDAPAAAGFAAAAATGLHDRRELRDRLVAGVRATVPDAVLRGHPTDRLPNNAHFTFPGCEGDSLLFLLDAAGVAVSTGSACQAGVPEPSHVLLGIGLDEQTARGALRMTLGRDTTDADVYALLAALPDAVARARRAGMADRRTSFAW